MPIPFGVGVGDFIAVGKLLRDIHNALQDGRGACDDYQSLMQQLDSLHKVMEILRLRILSKQLSDTATCNAITEEVKICEDLMLSFLEATEKYRDSLNKGGSRNKVMDAWRKMSWGLFRKEDVQELRESLRVHTDSISLLVTMSLSIPKSTAHPPEGDSNHSAREQSKKPGRPEKRTGNQTGGRAIELQEEARSTGEEGEENSKSEEKVRIWYCPRCNFGPHRSDGDIGCSMCGYIPT